MTDLSWCVWLQVRRESPVMESCNLGDQGQEHRLKRVRNYPSGFD
jgi:hypothetical protein